MAKDRVNQPQQQHQQPGMGDDPEMAESPMMVTLTKDALIELIREARRDPGKEAEIEAEAKRVLARRQQMVALAAQDERAKKLRQERCGHRKPNGEPTIGGQEFSDGRVRMFCLRCQVILREYWSPEVAKGMAIQQKMSELGITDDDVRQAMEVKGEGDPAADAPDDFALAVPRGVHRPSLTTES